MYRMYTIYCQNTCMMSTKIEAFYTLRIPFDIDFNTLFNSDYHSIQRLQTCHFFIHMVITRARGSPDMILTAFDLKSREKKLRYLPRPIGPKQNPKNSKVQKKMHGKKGIPSARLRGGSGGRSPPARKIIWNPVILIPENPCGLLLIIPEK